MIHEETNTFLLSAVMIPEENAMALFTSKAVTESNVQQYLYSSQYVGMIEGNALGRRLKKQLSVGTEFVVYDNGTDLDLLPEGFLEESSRKVVCKVNYDNNISGRKPNRMEVSLPATVDLEGNFKCRAKQLRKTWIWREKKRRSLPP